jgi:type IV secretory pathway TraG/TraD family ATPase VirD4
MGNRQKKAALLLIDEFHAFDNESITWLLSMARAFSVAVVIATQSTMSLGPDLQQRLLMSNTTTVIAFRTQYPEEICKRAGTKPETTHSMQHEYGVMTGLGNSRTEEAWKIHPNAIRQLPTGYAYIIRQGTYACVHFHQVTDIPNVAPEPDYTPAPPPPPAEESPVMELK